MLVLWQLALVAASVHALYSRNDAVIQATAATFKEVVLDTDHAVIVEFFAPWCGHCKNLAPEYKKAADSLKGLAKVVAVDCDADSNKSLCGQYQIQGFPTLKFFGKNKKSPSDFQGERKAKAIVDYVVSQIPNNVQLVGKKGKAKSIEEFLLNEPSLPKALLISKKSTTPPLLKAISTEFKGRLAIGELRTSETETLSLVETAYKSFDSYPVLLVLPGGSADLSSVVQYEGPMKSAPLTEFLDKHALPKPKKASKASKDGKKSDSKAKKAVKEEKPAVPFDPKVPEIVDQATLESLCVDKSSVCVLASLTLESEFPESVSAHKADLALLEKIKKKYHDANSPYHFAWLNPLRDPRPYLLTQFDAPDSYPGLLIVNAKKGVYRIHRGGFDEASIVQFLDDVLKGRGRNLKFDWKAVMVKETRKRVAEKDEL